MNIKLSLEKNGATWFWVSIRAQSVPDCIYTGNGFKCKEARDSYAGYILSDCPLKQEMPKWVGVMLPQLNVETSFWWLKVGRMPVGEAGDRVGLRVRFGRSYESAWAKA